LTGRGRIQRLTFSEEGAKNFASLMSGGRVGGAGTQPKGGGASVRASERKLLERTRGEEGVSICAAQRLEKRGAPA